LCLAGAFCRREAVASDEIQLKGACGKRGSLVEKRAVPHLLILESDKTSETRGLTRGGQSEEGGYRPVNGSSTTMPRTHQGA